MLSCNALEVHRQSNVSYFYRKLAILDLQRGNAATRLICMCFPFGTLRSKAGRVRLASASFCGVGLRRVFWRRPSLA